MARPSEWTGAAGYNHTHPHNHILASTIQFVVHDSVVVSRMASSLPVLPGVCFRGTYGLWLDGDIYHGRTHYCSTFNNDVLTESEDFVVSALEAWTFM